MVPVPLYGVYIYIGYKDLCDGSLCKTHVVY